MADPGMSRQSRILILAYTDITRDPRVRRQIEALRSGYDLRVLSRDATGSWPGLLRLPSAPAFTLQRKLCAAALLPWGIDSRPHVPPTAVVRRLLANQPPADLVLANDIEMLPIAHAIAGGAPVVFDAHEYYLDEVEPRLAQRLLVLPYLRRICRRLMPRCAAIMAVSHGIAARYRDEFSVDPVVVTNAAAAHDLAPTPVDPRRIRLVHHGNLLAGRHPELLIEAMDRIDSRFSLTLMLMPGLPAVEARLRDLVATRPRITMVPPVQMPEIVPTLNANHDLGIHLLPPLTFNDRMALPNKFFEFIQARLGVIIGPSPEMARIVEQEGIGIIAGDWTPNAIASAVNALTPARIAACKQAAHAVASRLHAGREAEIIRRVIATALGRV